MRWSRSKEVHARNKCSFILNFVYEASSIVQINWTADCNLYCILRFQFKLLPLCKRINVLFSCIQIYWHSHIVFHSLIDLGIRVITIQISPISVISKTQVHHRETPLHHITKQLWFPNGTVASSMGTEIWFSHISIFIYLLIWISFSKRFKP